MLCSFSVLLSVPSTCLELLIFGSFSGWIINYLTLVKLGC